MEKIVEPALPQVIVAQLGARQHYAVPVILHRAGMLAHLYTDIFLSPIASKLLNLPFLSRRPALKRLRGRFVPEIPRQRVSSFPRFGLMLARKHKLAGTDLYKQHQVHVWAGENFARAVIGKGVGRGNIVHTVLGEGLGIVTHPAARDLYKITDAMISPSWYSFILEEHRRWPGWDDGFNEYQFQEMANFDLPRLAIHWEHSDLILCPSEFVKQAIVAQGGPAERSVVVPYGFDLKNAFPKDNTRSKDDQLIKVIYVGGVVLGKGIQYLNEAMGLLQSKKISINAVGSPALSQKGLKILRQNLNLIGQVPRSEVSGFYQQADMFVFPSICEGSAIVCYEALAAGLPVITTPNAGSVVRDGIDGFIVPIRDPEALAEKIDLLAGDRKLRQWMSQNARMRAQEFSLEKYGERLIEALLTHWKGIRKGCTLQ